MEVVLIWDYNRQRLPQHKGVLAQIPPGSTFYQRADFQWMILLPNDVIAGPFPWNTAFNEQTDGSVLILDPTHAPLPPLPDDLKIPHAFQSISWKLSLKYELGFRLKSVSKIHSVPDRYRQLIK